MTNLKPTINKIGQNQAFLDARAQMISMSNIIAVKANNNDLASIGKDRNCEAQNQESNLTSCVSPWDDSTCEEDFSSGVLDQ